MIRLCQTARKRGEEKKGKGKKAEENETPKGKTNAEKQSWRGKRAIRRECTTRGVYLHLGTITNLDNENSFNVQRVDVKFKVGAVEKGDQM